MIMRIETMRNMAEVNIVTPSLSIPIEKPKLPPELDGVMKMSSAASGIYQTPNFFQELKTASFVKRRMRKIREREMELGNSASAQNLAIFKQAYEENGVQTPKRSYSPNITDTTKATIVIPIYIYNFFL